MSRLFTNGGEYDFVLNPYSELISGSATIQIAAPYVTKTEELVVAAKGGKIISLIAGINEGTSPKALSALLELPNCSVRYFTARFHAKIFLFDDAALVGSSNLTDAGLRSNREATLLIRDSQDLDEIRAFFLELWETAEALSPEKLRAFEKKRVAPLFADGNPLYEDAVGGRVEPRNIRVNSGQRNTKQMFVEQLRRQINQYKPAFTEVMRVIVEENYLRADLEVTETPFQTNRFLNWVRLTQAPEDLFAQAPIRSQEDRLSEIRRLGNLWVETETTRIPPDYPDKLRTAQRVFGSTESIENASKDEISEGLLSLHAFLEQLRFVKGGTANLAPFFWKKNDEDLIRVKRSLSWLVHGNGEFVERLHSFLYDPGLKLNYFGKFSALELFGTVKSQEFPPINGRMAKALRFIGYDVKTS